MTPNTTNDPAMKIAQGTQETDVTPVENDELSTSLSPSTQPKKPNTPTRELFALAIPALGTLVAAPLLLAADTAMVGYLGTTPLAGMSIASTIVATLVYVFIFLTYTTTAEAARLLGKGDQPAAVRTGIDGMWLGAALGLALAPITFLAGPALVNLMGAEGDVAAQAVTYLRFTSFGLIGMCVVLAGNGALRGLMDARTPFYVSLGGAVANVILNATFMYGLSMGIAGAGLGTALAQTGMAATLIAVVARGARRLQVPIKPDGRGTLSSFTHGMPLLLRTVALRACLVVTVMAATVLGPLTLAAHQVMLAIYALFSYPADAFGIGAQSLVGHALGTDSRGRFTQVRRTTVVSGLITGGVLGLVLACVSPWISYAFTPDVAIREAIPVSVLLMAVLLPVSSLVFVLDGILIGADQAWFMAKATVMTFVMYAPVVLGLAHYLATAETSPQWSLLALWASFMLVFLGSRALANTYKSWRL
ncbi:MAG: MATE family efflux transporter [Actinomycetaceae bacterium]|nr:MATE family efflux transporter [Actinomycetaceae bacterium]